MSSKDNRKTKAYEVNYNTGKCMPQFIIFLSFKNKEIKIPKKGHSKFN